VTRYQLLYVLSLPFVLGVLKQRVSPSFAGRFVRDVLCSGVCEHEITYSVQSLYHRVNTFDILIELFHLRDLQASHSSMSLYFLEVVDWPDSAQ
jgi:hypothetical protein